MKQTELDRRAFVMGSFGFGMAVLGVGMLAGCAASREDPVPVAPPQPVPREPTPGEPAAPTGRALVAVFSHSGNTLQVAERIAEETSVDLFRIETSDVWPEDYDAMTAQVQREQDEGYLPTIAAAVDDWEAYGTVYLGCPIWWGRLPHVMRAFLLQHDLAGKAVVPFCTSGGSGIEGALRNIRELYPEADLREPLALVRSSLPGALDEVRPWLEGSDLL